MTWLFPRSFSCCRNCLTISEEKYDRSVMPLYLRGEHKCKVHVYEFCEATRNQCGTQIDQHIQASTTICVICGIYFSSQWHNCMRTRLKVVRRNHPCTTREWDPPPFHLRGSHFFWLEETLDHRWAQTCVPTAHKERPQQGHFSYCFCLLSFSLPFFFGQSSFFHLLFLLFWCCDFHF